MPSESNPPWWRIPSWLVFLGFLAIGGFFLVTEHRAHAFGILPFLLLLACPLMHFMHGGHGGHGHDDGKTGSGETKPHQH